MLKVIMSMRLITFSSTAPAYQNLTLDKMTSTSLPPDQFSIMRELRLFSLPGKLITFGSDIDKTDALLLTRSPISFKA